jgi:hypothetical protein
MLREEAKKVGRGVEQVDVWSPAFLKVFLQLKILIVIH